jgi:hypothetical protein
MNENRKYKKKMISIGYFDKETFTKTQVAIWLIFTFPLSAR